jgi:predicted ribosome quality control (RQC) complex YloA/Tae2 family protein
MNWPNLNWREIHELANRLAPELEGLFVDRIIVPTRPRYPSHYIKGEWVIRFTGFQGEKALLFSARPRHPYFALIPGKGPAAENSATHSPFDLALNKQLKGLKLIKVWALEKERVLVLDFDTQMRLVVFMVPSIPEALLVKADPSLKPGVAGAKTWPVIVRSRTIRDNPVAAETFTLPDGSRAPDHLEIRADLMKKGALLTQLETWIDQEAFSLRIQRVEKILREKLKQASDRIRQSTVARKEALEEADWQRYADLLKSSMGTTPDTAAREREVMDYETGEKVIVPGDPKLSLKQQVEKFYQQARRKQRRTSEAQNRIDLFSETLSRLENIATELKALDPLNPDWKALEKQERPLGIQHQPTPSGASAPKRKGGSWLGKSFESKDLWSIWVGRNKDENLELTFKHARGNDLWLHVRGRPGSHVVIPVQPGKSVPLETLLDAANLVIYYSGGESWGKTEVDYTFKKHVKRIKDSSEASYVHNKTLIVQPDPVRLKRLLAEEK